MPLDWHRPPPGGKLPKTQPRGHLGSRGKFRLEGSSSRERKLRATGSPCVVCGSDKCPSPHLLYATLRQPSLSISWTLLAERSCRPYPISHRYSLVHYEAARAASLAAKAARCSRT
eukprot:scaffold133100_cov21-Phaeocystis_antarctica.AAC.1